jgi:hypothetical protein
MARRNLSEVEYLEYQIAMCFEEPPREVIELLGRVRYLQANRKGCEYEINQLRSILRDIRLGCNRESSR